MLGRAEALPGQCLGGWRSGLGWRLPARWAKARQLLVVGVGGSAIGGDLLQGVARSCLNRPVIVNRSYRIPAWVGTDTLVLVSSYSGNTEETLSAGQEAARRGAKLVALTSGGRLARWAQAKGLPLLQIPAGWPPRAAFGGMAFAPLGMLVRMGWLRKRDLPVERACDRMEVFVGDALNRSIPTRRNPAKRLACSLMGRLPVIYAASDGWEGVAYRWRTQLEENSKTLAFHHIFPEATHNEISGWLQPRSLMRHCAAVFLTDPAVHPRTRRRMLFTSRIIREQGARVLRAGCPGGSALARMLGLIALGDFTSVYLGLLYRQDPTPVVRVEALKRYLKR